MKWILGGSLVALLIGAGAWVYHDWQTGKLQSELDRMEASRDTWKESAQRWETTAVTLESEIKAERKAALRLESALEEVDSRYRRLRHQIRDAPDEDDGPVAPVLRRALEGLP